MSTENLRQAAVATAAAVHGGAQHIGRKLSTLLDGGDHALAGLADDVRSGVYVHGAAVAIDMQKPNGGTRRLAVPEQVDRVLERASLQIVGPLIDASLGPTAYAYRSGIGLGDAIRRLVSLREEGFAWAVRTDIEDCFPSIDRQRLRTLLADVIEDRNVIGLIGQFMARPVRDGSRLEWPARGIPQGSPLSPTMANLYLRSLDEHVTSRGWPMVRYADDLVIVAPNESSARAALEHVRTAAGEVGMALGPEKTEVLDFATGFCFLGEDINSRYPAAEPDPVGRVDRRVVYVGAQGSYVSMRSGRVHVSRKRAELLDVPSQQVCRVVAFGSVTLAPGFTAWALNSDVDVVLCSRRGSLLGALSPVGQTSTETRRTQFERSDDDDFSTRLGISIEKGKLFNQRVLLQRRISPDTADALSQPIAQLAGLMQSLAAAGCRDEVFGVEGAGARAYFGALRALLPPEVGFERRETRPPTCVVNAALSYGYTILVGECVTALAAAGLDPSIGLLHANRGARFSLALDLVEEFRPLIVDSVVVAMARAGELGLQHGRPLEAGRGVLLTETGRTAVIRALERRLLTKVHHVGVDKRITYRWAIHLQAQALRRSIIEGDVPYQPMLWRV